MGGQEGRDEGFEAAFDELFPRAERLAFQILGNRAAAEDVAAEALARTYLHWRRVRALSYRDGWVLRVATNLAIDDMRRRRPEPDEDAGMDPEEAAAMRVTLAAALSRLSGRQRTVVTLHYLSGLTEAEVADSLGLSLPTVKTHVRRGMQSLRRTLGDSFEEVPVATR
ncbi:MAG: sigma-70 family RNA polymerase sigma factor [Acidimicrobiia bacterium]|nr:sigma-70 family RNA polymerase sigma factor [Acidimicrobiia bacterium]